MSATRSLPKKLNPLILPEVSPDYEELLSRRRLGKTYLSVKPGQIGTSNATKPENLGLFEYAHLRAPIPKDLRGSEIFSLNAQAPNTYFLMRRSRDGYISATGMFKIAFPWAKHTEEKAEREYLKSRQDTSEDEVAGNVWISPELALELAKEYQMLDWVRALLDPTDISPSMNSPEKNISPPPKFEMPSTTDATTLEPPPSLARNRARRSASPVKAPVSARKIATPRRSRQTRAQKESSSASSTAANESLQNTLDAAASTTEPIMEEEAEGVAEVNGDNEAQEESAKSEDEQAVSDKKSPENVKVNVKSAVDVDTALDVETKRTNVFVEMPTAAPELPLPEDTETMIAKAKEMVEEASKLQEEKSGNPTSSRSSRKRKAAEKEEDDVETEATPAQPAKRAKVLENTLRRERVRNRALIGVTATLALAATIPYFF